MKVFFPFGRRASTVPSPCVQLCELDPGSRTCRGCLRTVEEIQAWRFASDREKRSILDRVEERRPRAD